ncbi:MAG: hypothetical protein WA093_00295 [Minisyncoccales bacterium]
MADELEVLRNLATEYQRLFAESREISKSFFEIRKASEEVAKKEGWVTFWPYLAVPTESGKDKYIRVGGGCFGRDVYESEAAAKSALRNAGLTVRRRDGDIMAMVAGVPRDTRSKIVPLRDTFQCPLARKCQEICESSYKKKMEDIWKEAWQILRPRIPKEHCVLVVSQTPDAEKGKYSDRRVLTFAEYVSHILEGELAVDTPIIESGEGTYMPDGNRPAHPD